MSKEKLISKKTEPEEQDIVAYNRWLFYEYKKRIIQQDDSIYKFIGDNINSKYNGSNRDYAAKCLKKYIWINSTNTIVTIFRIRDSADPQAEAVIYTFLYSTVLFVQKSKDKLTKMEHSYFCPSPSLMSRDGEYRQRIIKFSTVETVISKYSQLWNKLEEYMLRKINDSTWNYYTEYFYPTAKYQKLETQMISTVGRQRLPIKFMIISWFIELFNIVNNIPVNHINKTYLNVMGFSNKEILNKDAKFYKKIVNEFGVRMIYSLRHDLNVYSVSEQVSSLKLGQKLIPLNLSEAQNPFNIRYKPWKEFLISEKAQDLIINGICKGYPFIGDYFYLRDVRKTMFDNYIQYLKLEHSEQAVYITRKLIEAKMATYYTEHEYKRNPRAKERKNTKNVVIEESFDEINMWLSEKFRRLYQMIDNPIKFSKRNLIMSEVALGVISEFVGRSFYDFILLNDKKTGSDFYISETGDSFENYDIWAKYIFECIYDLLCLNIHMGVIHGDLHLNNTTIHPMFYKEHADISNLIDKGIFPYMLYIMKASPRSNESVVYGFPSRQYHSCIIDFSRSIILPSKVEEYTDYNINESKNLKLYKKGPIHLLDKGGKDKFYNEQVSGVLHILENLFPNMYDKNKAVLELLISNYLEKLFPLLTAIDIYRFSSELIKFFKNKKLSISSKHIKLIKDINSKAEMYLTSKLLRIIKDPSLLDTKESTMFANWDIINNYFSEFIVMSTYEGEWKQSQFHACIVNNTNTIIDVSVLHNKHIYSLDSYKDFPPFLKYTKLMNKDGKIKSWKKKKDPTEFLRKVIEKEKKKNLEVISLIAHRHKEKFF